MSLPRAPHPFPRPKPRHVCVTCLHWSHGCTLKSGPKAAATARWFDRYVEVGVPPRAPKTAPPCPGWVELWPRRTDWMRGGRPRWAPGGWDVTPAERAYWWGTGPAADDPEEAP